ncbi:MAG: 2-methylcitrate dehydratase PrpD [Gammaproteobacteria bacterium]|jgi:2-methylcitrate dehydratase PrpD
MNDKASTPVPALTLALADRIIALRFETLPRAVVDAAAVGLLDSIGVTLAGSVEPCAVLVRQTLQVGGLSAGACTVLGTDLRCGALDAAMMNGVAAHALDFDDCNNTVGGHPTVPMLPAILALAEMRPISGAQLVGAYVAGFETMAAFGRVLNMHHYQKGWHPTATLGIFAGAAASAYLLDLDRERTATALAIAASLAAGIKANFGTMTKPLHVGHCARNALFAALLAEQGFTAHSAALEHPQGFFEVFNGAGNYAMEQLLDGWADPYELLGPGLAIKAYPCCASTHPAVDAALQLAQLDGADAADVERIVVRSHERRLRHTNRPNPSSGLEAKFSVQHCVARALLDGSVTMEHFDGERHAEAPVRELMARIEAIPHQDDNHFGAYLTLHMRDGRELTTYVPTPLGRDRDNPLPREQLLEKFHACATRVVDADAAVAIERYLDDITRLNDTATLVHLTRSATS